MKTEEDNCPQSLDQNGKHEIFFVILYLCQI